MSATDSKLNRQTENANGRTNPAGKAPNALPEFDWVTERSFCSLAKVFSTLRRQIEHDIDTRNGLRPNYSPYKFSLAEDTNKITVRLEADRLRSSVEFLLSDHAISVRDDQGKLMFDVTLTFDDQGKCRLNVNGEERDFWQVRRMALEDLMFRGL